MDCQGQGIAEVPGILGQEVSDQFKIIQLGGERARMRIQVSGWCSHALRPGSHYACVIGAQGPFSFPTGKVSASPAPLKFRVPPVRVQCLHGECRAVD